MRYLHLLIPAVFIIFSACSDDDPLPEIIEDDDPTTARYEVTFEAVWSASTHPVDFPPNPHFSGLIGATHNEDTRLFEVGQIASEGIMSMAETGSKNPLKSEIESQVSAGNADFVINGSGVSPSPGSTSLEMNVNTSHPYASITTMIAPSPDWFLAVSAVNLYEDGQWVDNLVVEAGVYDSGSDSGETFTSPNSATNPFQPVFTITDGPLAVDGEVATMGTFTFRRISEVEDN